MNTNSMLQVIKNYVQNITNCATYVGNEIPHIMLRTILNDFGNPNAQPLAFIDAGMRGNYNEGVLFTDTGIDFRYLGNVGHVAYSDIRSIEPMGNNCIMIRTTFGDYQIDLPFDIGLIVGAIEEILGRTLYTGPKAMPPRPENHPDMHERPGMHGNMHGEPRPDMGMHGNHRPDTPNQMPGNGMGQQHQMPGHNMGQQAGSHVKPASGAGHSTMPSGRPGEMSGGHSGSGNMPGGRTGSGNMPGGRTGSGNMPGGPGGHSSSGNMPGGPGGRGRR